MTKTMIWAGDGTPPSAALLHLLAAALRAGSDILTRLAVRLSAAEATRTPVHTVEFHSLYGEAGAPEGALYVNGELVGRIPGVTRL